MIKAILCDIEGTTTDINFVHKVLFPYSRKRLRSFLKENPEIEADASLLEHWIDTDQKEPLLKKIQGLIWEKGYFQGDYKAHLYEDVLPNLKKWKNFVDLYIYSSGSVHAQKLLFGHTEYGDVNSLFSGYFDTSVGGKKESSSYKRILKHLNLSGEEVLFLSDSIEELDAAGKEGIQTCQIDRQKTGNCVHSFNEIEVNPKCTLYSEKGSPLREIHDNEKISELLSERGVRFEQWAILKDIKPEEILKAYEKDIKRLDYKTCDVISLGPDHPQKDELRNKFLSEHTHSEDEVRFFVKGKGLFVLHLGDEVCSVLCEKGDLISVPKDTPHWFDMGERPDFSCIRLFDNPEGWVAKYTGSGVDRFFSGL